MKFVGIIPSRYGSTRFPGKPLIDLKGKTMIQRAYEGASKSSLLSRIIVATDDQRIYDEVIRFGGEVIMTSQNHKSGTDRCGEVAEKIDADVVINIQGDEPLVDYRQLDALCQAFEDSSVQIATMAVPRVSKEDQLNPNRIKLVLDHNRNAMYFSRSPLPNDYHAKDEVKESFPYLRHVGLYAYRSNTLKTLVELEPASLEQIESLEQLRWLYHGYKIRVIETLIETPNIDVPEDIDKVLELL